MSCTAPHCGSLLHIKPSCRAGHRGLFTATLELTAAALAIRIYAYRGGWVLFVFWVQQATGPRIAVAAPALQTSAIGAHSTESAPLGIVKTQLACRG